MTLSIDEASKRVDIAIKALLNECDERKARIITSGMSEVFRDHDAKVVDVIVALVSQLASIALGHSDDDILVFTMMVIRLMTEAVIVSKPQYPVH